MGGAVGHLTRSGLAGLALGLCLSAAAQGATQSEDFTVDPGWTGNGNTTYGYSASTSNAGGAVGEAGGAVPSRTNDITWYADTTLGGNLTQLEPFSASGRFTISPRTDFDGGFAIGFFDAVAGTLNNDDGHIKQGAYFRVLDGDGAKYRVLSSLAGNRSSTSEPGVIVIDGDVDYLFNLNYNPTGGGAAVGRLTVELRFASDNSLLESTFVDTSNALGYNFNAFGIQTGDFNRVEPPSNVFIDDLTYTVVPEPAGAALLGCAALSLLNRRGRRQRTR
jgi:hypothetical protein